MITLVDETEGEHPSLALAGLNDIDDILELAKEFHVETPYSPLNLDLTKIRVSLEKFIIEQGTDHLVLLSKSEGKVVGVLAAYAYEPLFSRERMAIELFWYLKPEFRRGSRGTEMMDAYEYWARKAGCVLVQYGVLASSPDGMKKLYERRGMDLTEQIYQKVF